MGHEHQATNCQAIKTYAASACLGELSYEFVDKARKPSQDGLHKVQLPHVLW